MLFPVGRSHRGVLRKSVQGALSLTGGCLERQGHFRGRRHFEYRFEYLQWGRTGYLTPKCANSSGSIIQTSGNVVLGTTDANPAGLNTGWVRTSYGNYTISGGSLTPPVSLRVPPSLRSAWPTCSTAVGEHQSSSVQPADEIDPVFTKPPLSTLAMPTEVRAEPVTKRVAVSDPPEIVSCRKSSHPSRYSSRQGWHRLSLTQRCRMLDDRTGRVSRHFRP